MIPVDTLRSSRQNADLTFKLNRRLGRHGWLRLTPAYSVKLVCDLLAAADRGIRVLDPFSGTATTALCAAYAGDKGAAVEINPFLTWFGNAKLAQYADSDIRCAEEVLSELIHRTTCCRNRAMAPPAMHNVWRWWDQRSLDFLCKFKAALDEAQPQKGPVRDMLLVIFCRLVIDLSNAAFNHQSMSFKDKAHASQPDANRQGLLFSVEPDLGHRAGAEARVVLSSAGDNPGGTGSVVCGDSRRVSDVVQGQYDLLITSPPYPNRMSYIRELRPYMYWLGYLETGRDAGELDWSAIGGTWGIATSRLAEWRRSSDGFYPSYFVKILSGIHRADNKSGTLLSNYVAKYFEDMWLHIKDVVGVMSSGGVVHYIVGNSTFYDVVVPTEQLLADMLVEAGFREPRIARIRKRNSKKELYEFDVSATKP